MRTRLASAAAGVLALTVLASGCNFESFEDACKDKGGVVETDRESCTRTENKTTTVKGKTKTTSKQVSGTRTEKECLVDGREVDEDEGSCS